MYKRLLTVTFIIIGLCMILTLIPIHGEEEIYSTTLRLHVIANSDSEEDQTLKLCVRDEILKATGDIFRECKSREEAERLVNENMEAIRRCAEKTVRSAGYNYPVSIILGKEEYPTKNYEGACFPSGVYSSLRVIIGEGDGQNWWCVLFPPMCVGAASHSDASIQVGLNTDQYNIITENDDPKYKIRFKLLESIQRATK